MLSIGTTVNLTSHNYPNYYPPSAYVLWTFQYAGSTDSSDIRYRISFGYIYISDYDYLKVGPGWDPDDYSLNITTIYGYFDGYYDDVLLPAGNMFVEFYSYSDYYTGQGFHLMIRVQNLTGTLSTRHPTDVFRRETCMNIR